MNRCGLSTGISINGTEQTGSGGSENCGGWTAGTIERAQVDCAPWLNPSPFAIRSNACWIAGVSLELESWAASEAAANAINNANGPTFLMRPIIPAFGRRTPQCDTI